MGYGRRALKLLKNYYSGKFTSLDENEDGEDDDSDDNGKFPPQDFSVFYLFELNQSYTNHVPGYEKVDDENVGLLKEVIAPRKKVPTLLKKLSERRPERLDYIGTSYGLTKDLLKFWKSQKFVPVYLRYVFNGMKVIFTPNPAILKRKLTKIVYFFSQKANDLTGEYSTIMISTINLNKTETKNWLGMYYHDFRRRFMKLLGKTFQHFTTGLALSILDNEAVATKAEGKAYVPLGIFFIEKY